MGIPTSTMGQFVQKISISLWQIIFVNPSVTSSAFSGVVLETQLKIFYSSKHSDFQQHISSFLHFSLGKFSDN